MKTIVVLGLSGCVAILILVMAVPNHNGTNKLATDNRMVQPQPFQTGEVPLILKVDDTSSISSQGHARGNELLLKHADADIESGQFTVARIQHFGQSGWLLDERIISLPKRTSLPCEPPVIAADRAWYKPWVESEKKKTDEACVRTRAQAESEFVTDKQKALDAISTALSGIDQANSNCTAFYDTLASSALVTRKSLTVIASDAVDTCAGAVGQMPAPPAGVRIEIILLPTKYDEGRGASAFDSYKKRVETLHRIAPWLEVQPPSAVGG